MGSIGLARYGMHISCPAYKISKAALNMLTVQYAIELEEKGFTIAALSPGVSYHPAQGLFARVLTRS